MTQTILHELGHLSLYLIAIIIVKTLTKKSFSPKIIIFGLFTTLLIDIDHLFDYVMSQGFSFNPSLMLSGAYFHTSGKVFVLLHSWELIVLLFVTALFLKRKNKPKTGSLFLITAIALVIHLFFDLLSYGFNPLVYSIYYRYLNNFGLTILN